MKIGSPTGKHLILPLNRPQYVPYPEALSSSLAWSPYASQIKQIGDDGKKRVVALMYRAGANTEKVLKTLAYRQTGPDTDAARLAAFGEALKAAGLKSLAPDQTLPLAAGMSILGVKSNKSPNQPAAPMSKSLALLQNDQGFLGAANPPAMDQILESIFALGLSDGDASETVFGRWEKAVDHRVEIDVVVRALDAAASAVLLDFPLDPATQLPPAAALNWAGLLDGTPFSWFRRSWTRLTSDDWVEALPARVWVDWASTVLRTAIGTSFLWEALWYENVARTVLKGSQADWWSLRKGVVEVLPWKPSTSDVAVRDVSSLLLWRVRRSNQIKQVVEEWIDAQSCGDSPLADALKAMGSDKTLIASLELALVSKSKGAKNLWESVKYSLMARDETGDFADHYGLLRGRRPRYLLVDPGTEWMAVMASLCVREPGRQTHLRDVMKAFAECGLRPELSEVIALLERAGLARGSADADEGVLVQSAF